MKRFSTSDWWPDYVKQAFVAVGKVMTSNRLYPKNLDAIPKCVGAIVPEHSVSVVHVSGSEAGKRKGKYILTIDGPRIGGTWAFQSGELEQLALWALETSAPTKPSG